MAASSAASLSRTIAHVPLHYSTPSLHFCTSNLSPPSHFFFTLSLPSSFNHHRRLSPIHLRRSYSGLPANPNRSIRWCQSGSAGSQPSPPERPDPDPGNPPVRSTGVGMTLSRIWDSIQIFFAVLFWMALFFWASAWDGRNSGRRNTGNRFRR